MHHLYIPHPALRPYIRNYAYIEMGETGKWNRTNIAPTGRTILSFALNTRQVSVKTEEETLTLAPLAFSTQTTTLKPFCFYNQLKSLLFIFEPCGAYRLLGIRPDRCPNYCTSLSELLGVSIEAEIAALSSQKRLQDTIMLLEQFLLQRLNQKRKWHVAEQLAPALKEIERNSNLPDVITKSCCKYGFSLRSLERHMQEFVGLRPKIFQRIARFNATLKHMEYHHYQCNWAQLAYQFGYCDQSHFIKDFKSFYGKTPKISSSSDNFISNVVLQSVKQERA